MDLNFLYHRHQIALFMADNASSDAARQVHRELATRYAAQIADRKNPTAAVPAA